MKIFRAILKHTLLVINALFVIGYIFALFSNFVPPYRIVFFSYFGLLFPVFVIGNIFFVVFWAIRKKWFWLISAALLLFSFPHANACFTIPYKSFGKQKTEQEIKILTYNISSLNKLNKKAEREQFFDFIAETDADIVCFQEFGYRNEKDRDFFLAEMKKNYPYSHIWYKNQAKTNAWGVATFSKFPIIFKKKIEFESKYNVSVFSDIVVNEDTVRVFNNHLESNKFSMTDVDKYYSIVGKSSKEEDGILDITSVLSQKMSDAYKIRAVQARIVAREIKKSPYKKIVCGDFNDVVESYAYHTIKGNLTDLYTSTSWGYRYTFYTKRMYVGIDHILIDKHFKPLSTKILHKKFSDHYPVVGEFGY
ncbi:MAG: endonuclease/exonuclease/phosphatase family protein [Prevotellaceae bacterium]|jgi:endonuclease/exonuclease/phosphatase family metal-dependent hydrolase|nr:endonuclease/exonuclease/phosphatase family protein [Prevotellaceae bacterium]